MLCILPIMGIQILVMRNFFFLLITLTILFFCFVFVGDEGALVKRNDLGKLSSNILEK